MAHCVQAGDPSGTQQGGQPSAASLLLVNLQVTPFGARPGEEQRGLQQCSVSALCFILRALPITIQARKMQMRLFMEVGRGRDRVISGGCCASLLWMSEPFAAASSSWLPMEVQARAVGYEICVRTVCWCMFFLFRR